MPGRTWLDERSERQLLTRTKPIACRKRQAEPDDVEFLLALRRITMVPYRVVAGIPESAEQTRASVLADFESAWVVLSDDDEPIGLFKASTGRSSWTLSQIQLLPAWQRRGIGTALISGFLADARQAGAAVDIRVLKVNPALALYKRLGFRITSESTHGYTLSIEP